MSTGTRLSLTQARAAAAELVMALHPACERIEVAGSIRRGKADVGDIELVAVPRLVSAPEGLFGEMRANLLTERVDHIIDTGSGFLANHPTDRKRGERYSKLWMALRGIQVDLFSAAWDTFGLILLIRTGPADYSQRFVTKLRGRGLHVAKGELHRGSLGCGAYVCEVVPTPYESDVYSAAGWDFVEPEDRA